ncbi:hypothetical protein HDU67_005066, partial [Dinochytrium kinnereticum]
DSFADGWGVGQNLATGRVGFMPMHFLNPDLVVGNGGSAPHPSPPPSPTLVATRERSGEGNAGLPLPSYMESVSGSMQSLSL